jgi:surfeit locus 1 family protein
MSWKQEIIASFEQQMAKQPVMPPLDIKKDTDWRYTRVRATGRFLHDKEILLTGRTFEGTAGFHVVTPFLFDGGRIVLINRGWVPEKLRERKSRPQTTPTGIVVMEGILRETTEKATLFPKMNQKMRFGCTLIQNKLPNIGRLVQFPVIISMNLGLLVRINYR